jgi:hypothetical protein
MKVGRIHFVIDIENGDGSVERWEAVGTPESGVHVKLDPRYRDGLPVAVEIAVDTVLHPDGEYQLFRSFFAVPPTTLVLEESRERAESD